MQIILYHIYEARITRTQCGTDTQCNYYFAMTIARDGTLQFDHDGSSTSPFQIYLVEFILGLKQQAFDLPLCRDDNFVSKSAIRNQIQHFTLRTILTLINSTSFLDVVGRQINMQVFISYPCCRSIGRFILANTRPPVGGGYR